MSEPVEHHQHIVDLLEDDAPVLMDHLMRRHEVPLRLLRTHNDAVREHREQHRRWER